MRVENPEREGEGGPLRLQKHMARDRRGRLKEAGLCYRCGKNPNGPYGVCTECRERRKGQHTGA